MLSSGENESEVRNLVATALDKNFLTFYGPERQAPLIEIYEFLGLSPENALAHSALYPQISIKPATAILTLSKELADVNSDALADHITTQVHLGRLLRATFENEFRNSKSDATSFELTMNSAEGYALKKLPPDTFYGEGEMTVAQRLEEIRNQNRSLVELEGAARTKLAAAPESGLRDFFTLWNESGFRAALEFIAKP